MKAKAALFPIFLPMLITVKIVEYFVWELLSDGRWKRHQVKGNPAKRWQNEALKAQRELRAQEARFRQRYQVQEQEFHKKLRENQGRK